MQWRMNGIRGGLSAIGLGILLISGFSLPGLARTSDLLYIATVPNLRLPIPDSLPPAPTPQSGATDPIRPPIVCPTTLDELTPLLLRDLPSYANRVNQRAFGNYETPVMPGYVLLAERPEFAPLSLGPGIYTPLPESEPSQIFFTTLERQYVAGRDAVKLQQYHWLFLAHTEKGWNFVLMLSAIGDYPENEPPTPPRDSSQGVIAQAVRLWLRDCEAGSVTGAGG